MIQCWSLDKPIWQERNLRFDQLEGWLFIDSMSICRDETVGLYWQEGAEWDSQCDVVEWGHCSLVIWVVSINYRPLRKARNIIVARFIVRVLLNFEFTGGVEGQERSISEDERETYFVMKQTADPKVIIPLYSRLSNFKIVSSSLIWRSWSFTYRIGWFPEAWAWLSCSGPSMARYLPFLLHLMAI